MASCTLTWILMNQSINQLLVDGSPASLHLWSWWWWWWSWSSSSLLSSSKGFCLWKMQHFLELFFPMNSLSTVPSFHVTFFFLGLSRKTRVCWLLPGSCNVMVLLTEDDGLVLVVLMVSYSLVELWNEY